MTISARYVATELVARTESEQAYANLLLPKLLAESGLDDRDRAFATELGYGTLRLQGTLDRIVEVYIPDPSRVSTQVRAILRVGSYQLLFTRVPLHAAISETVNLCREFRHPKATGFVNAVLRKVGKLSFEEHTQRLFPTLQERDSDEGLSFRYAHPEWIIRSFRESLSVQTAAVQNEQGSDDATPEISLQRLLEHNNKAAKVNLVRLASLTDYEENEILSLTEPNPYSPQGLQLQHSMPWSIRSVKNGKLRVQDEGSQLAALALIEARKISPGEIWADFCSGPGGKAAVLAAVAGQKKLDIVLNEINPTRALLVEQAVKPINPDAFISVQDARTFGDEHPESFDRILLDAPCSGIGSLRRRPESRWRKTPAEIGKLLQLQSELIASAVKSLKPGGILAYVTCSPHLSETVQQVGNAIKHHRLTALNVNAVLNTITVQPLYDAETEHQSVQLWPHQHNTDAMFISLLQKPNTNLR